MSKDNASVKSAEATEETRKRLYGDYMREILKIARDNKQFTQKEVDSDIKHIYYSKNIKWHDIWRDGEIVGFVIIGTGAECHPHADYFIIQAYIIPSCRRLGIGKSFLKEYIQNHPGTYCLDILDKNEIAHRFWANVFIESGYSRVVLPYIEHGEGDDAHMYAWAPCQ